MANWAIVIGVDKYWKPDVSLRGAVRDALDIRQWLLDPAGGNVPATNLTLLLEPDRTAPPSGTNFLNAKHNTVVSAIEQLLTRSGAQGERFFFHFSGHGLTGRVNFSHQSAILASDFTDILPTNSLTVASLFELFQGTQFGEQYFFIDACRNLPFDTDKRLGEYPNPREPVPPVSPQFVMYATQPGLKAVEIRNPGDERGAFTRALRDGLRGMGSAKKWDDEKGDYVVRWDSLFKHVESTVKALKLKVTAPPAGPLIQEPREFGEHGSLDPEFARFPESGFSNETLQIDLDPSQVRHGAHVAVGELGEKIFEQGPPVADLPVTVRLPPRIYAVVADAPGYVMRKRRVKVDLYQAERITVELDPASSVPPVAPVPPAPPIGPVPTASINLPVMDRSLATGGGPRSRPRATGAVFISSTDALAQIELAKASGQLITSGRGNIFATDLRTGFYRARLISPEGVTTEELIEVLPVLPDSQAPTITLSAPNPTTEGMKWAIAAGHFFVKDDGTVEPSESVKATASLKLSTVLALAAGASVEGPKAPYGHKLRSLGIPGFYSKVSPTQTNGVMVLFGDETLDPNSWRETEVRCSSQFDKSVHGDKVEFLAGVAGIAYTAFPATPGAYWLSLRFAKNESLLTATAVLPGRMTLLVLTREADRSLELHEYQPLLGDAPLYPNISYEERQRRDPLFGDSRFAAMRRIEWMQRSVAHGRVTPTVPDIEMLLYDKWIDPMAGCMGGYLLVRMGRLKDLETPTRNLVKYFGELPDAHVLHGVYLEATHAKEQARNAYVEALERGMPIYRDGLALLNAAAGRLKVAHPKVKPLAEFLSKVPSGSLWSITPERSDHP